MSASNRFVFALCALAFTFGATQAHASFSSSAQTMTARLEAAPSVRLAQLFGPRQEDSDLVARLGRLENQIRQLTGMIEELQHRNSQLEQQLRRAQEDADFRFQEKDPNSAPRRQSGTGPAPRVPPSATREMPPLISAPPQVPTGSNRTPGGRGDAFDPSAAPSAPGAPRPLGTLRGSEGEAPRVPGAPLDLGPPSSSGGSGQAEPLRGVPGPQAVLAPSGSARDEYDLAYGAILRRDYELASEAFQRFLANHGGERLSPDAQRLVPEAHYWLGESHFQREQYNDAAESYLDLYNKYPNSLRAPEALLRLGQSLAALGKQDAACASLGAALSKYPKASADVKRAVEQEQKRVRC